MINAMADFIKSFNKTVLAEGGYVNNPNDKGGETYMGVTRKNHKDSKMWDIIDLYKKTFKGTTLNKKLKAHETLQDEVKKIYYDNYWKVISLDKFKSQRIANQVFDVAVNCGVTAAIRMLQRISKVPVTGKLNEELLKKYI